LLHINTSSILPLSSLTRGKSYGVTYPHFPDWVTAGSYSSFCRIVQRFRVVYC